MMTVVLNNEPQLEYDRDKPLPDHQALYLDKMDEKMNAGITIGEEHIDNPDLNQRIQFVAANLGHALKNDEEALMASLTTYIATRLPELKQIRFTEVDDGIEIDLNFDKPYAKEVLVPFPKKLN
jgi:hypothetical protein